MKKYNKKEELLEKEYQKRVPFEFEESGCDVDCFFDNHQKTIENIGKICYYETVLEIRGVKNMKKTKIICSIGPSTQTWEVFKGLVEAGMNVARINFSHATIEERKLNESLIKRANEE